MVYTLLFHPQHWRPIWAKLIFKSYHLGILESKLGENLRGTMPPNRRNLVFALMLIATLLPARAWQSSVSKSMEEGAAAMRAGKSSEAVSAFARAVAADPQSPEAYMGLGMAELRAGDADAAAKALARCLAIDPSARGAQMFLGIARYQQNDFAAASAALHVEINADPRNVEALAWLGIVELAADRPEDAAGPLDQAAVLAPKDANILFLQGKTHALLSQKAYQALYKLDPDSWHVHRALAENFAASGESEKAIAEYEAAIRKEPGNADLYEELAEQDQKLSRVEAARTAYEQALRLHPRSAIALYNLGKIDVETGKPALGIPLLEQAVEAHAVAAPAHFYLGLGLAEVGRNDQAVDALNTALSSNPSAFIRESALYQLARVYQKLNRKQDAEQALSELKQLKEHAGGQTSPRK